MAHDEKTKAAFEHKAQEAKLGREESRADDALNEAALRADNHTGQQGTLLADRELIEGSEVKALYALLPDFHKDELRRVLIVPPGTRLNAGDAYCDARFRESGELVAHGEEEIHDELLVPKNAVDYEIWNKLLRKSSAEITG